MLKYPKALENKHAEILSIWKYILYIFYSQYIQIKMCNLLRQKYNTLVR